tara:strand:- start:16 stop:528 length:513 start_codon:yes stop_codon:yes gene_type:complete
MFPDSWVDPDAEAAVDALQELVGLIRSLRAEYRIEPSTKVVVYLGEASESLELALEEEGGSVLSLAQIASIEPMASGPGGPGAHAVLKTGGDIFLPLEGVVDLGKERARIQSEVDRTRKILAGTTAKLGNRGFIENAKPDVVERERAKLVSLKEQMERLEEKLQTLGSVT